MKIVTTHLVLDAFVIKKVHLVVMPNYNQRFVMEDYDLHHSTLLNSERLMQLKQISTDKFVELSKALQDSLIADEDS